MDRGGLTGTEADWRGWDGLGGTEADWGLGGGGDQRDWGQPDVDWGDCASPGDTEGPAVSWGE